jgi:hypothetical protein
MSSEASACLFLERVRYAIARQRIAALTQTNLAMIRSEVRGPWLTAAGMS